MYLVAVDRYRPGDLHDVLIHQVFAVSLELHSALTLISDPDAAARIRHAITGLDQALNDLRTAIFQRTPATVDRTSD